MNMENDITGERIIRATFDILRKEGFDKTTTKKIAAAAEVNEVTIFRKFENKKNLMTITKDYYMGIFLKKLDDIFSYEGDEEIEDYLQKCFLGVLNCNEEDFSIVQVAIQEVRVAPDKRHLIAQITDTILDNLEGYFKIQVEKGIIKDLNPKAVSLMCFSVIFQSLVLWQIYGTDPDITPTLYAQDFLDMIFYGIKPQ